MTARDGDALAAALRQIAEQRDQLAGQDKAIADLHLKLTALRGELKRGGKQQAGGEEDDSYAPAPTVEWWRISDEDRAAAIWRLEAWVRDVYLPGYGWLARMLPDCWREHPLCLYVLDWLSELWSVLYLNPERTRATLAGQTELQTRILPAVADQLKQEGDGCEHSRPRQNGRTQPARPR